MPRQARRKSSSKVHHIMLRGINREDIFHDDEDCQSFLFALSRVKKETDFALFAYCLMSNHIHLLLKEGETAPANILKRLGASFVYWYNRKYERVGHLFQGRYKSEPVEDDAYLLMVLRYIHNNPVAAGLTKTAADYRWSSYNDYFADMPANDLTDTAFILKMFSPERKKARQLLKEFSLKENEDRFLDVEESVKSYLPDEAIISIIRENAGLSDPAALKNASEETKEGLIRQLRGQGASLRQLARLTGISKSAIDRIK